MRNRDILLAILAPSAPAFDGDPIEERVLEAVARRTLEKYPGHVPERDPERDGRDFKSLLSHLDMFVARLSAFRAYAEEHFEDFVNARDEQRAEWNNRIFAALAR